MNVRMASLLDAYSRALMVGGLGLGGAVLVLDSRGTHTPTAGLIVLAATIVLRVAPIRVTAVSEQMREIAAHLQSIAPHFAVGG